MKQVKCRECMKFIRISRKNVIREGPYNFANEKYFYYAICPYCKKRQTIKFKELPFILKLCNIFKR